MKALGYMILAIFVLLGAILLWNPTVESPYEEMTYNNFEFKKVSGTWFFDWQKDNKVYTVGLRYNPEEVENVTIKGALNSSFNHRRDVYITYDPEISENTQNFTTLALAATELSTSVAKSIGYKPLSACTWNASVCADAGTPIVSCDTPGVSVIYLTDVGDAGIVLDKDCITLRGEEMELLRSVDRLLYQWYGIMGERWT